MKELSKAKEAGLYRSNPAFINKLRVEIQGFKFKEEIMWKKRSHVDWLKEGDRNTRYFHCKANQRNKHNFILGIENDISLWIEDESHMGGGGWLRPISLISSLPRIRLGLRTFSMACFQLSLQK